MEGRSQTPHPTTVAPYRAKSGGNLSANVDNEYATWAIPAAKAQLIVVHNTAATSPDTGTCAIAFV
jgi:hypothetical protein